MRWTTFQILVLCNYLILSSSKTDAGNMLKLESEDDSLLGMSSTTRHRPSARVPPTARLVDIDCLEMVFIRDG
jgi:hypothetical protein